MVFFIFICISELLEVLVHVLSPIQTSNSVADERAQREWLMFFFAWSIILDAVSHARRQRLASALSAFVLSRDVSRYTLLGRRSTNTSAYQGRSSAPVYRASSEPALNLDESDETLYRNEEKEIVARPGRVLLQLSDWRPIVRQCEHSQNEMMKRSGHLIYFIVRADAVISASTSQLSGVNNKVACL